MKKLLFILLSAISLIVFAQEKKVAVYVTGQESGINKVLGDQLVAAFAKSGRYAAIERTSSFLAELNKEQNYQRSGAVNDNEIARIGEQFGVNYVCVADITEAFGEKYISARLIDVETAEVENTHNVSGEMNSMSACVNMASEIASNLSKGTFREQEEDARRKAREQELERQRIAREKYEAVYVDLGLPSKTIWRTENEEGFYNFTAAKNKFGRNLPSEAQWKELLENCTWVLESNYYRVIGPNGKSMLLPSSGLYDCKKGIKNVGTYASYLSSTPCGRNGDSMTLGWDLNKRGKEKPVMYIAWRDGCIKGTVRCIK